MAASLTKPQSTSDYLAGSKILLSPAQKRCASLILERFTEAGYSPAIAMAAVANAYSESALKAGAVGDNGQSIGLFQLYDEGAGKGIPRLLRRIPWINVQAILTKEKGTLAGIKDIPYATTATIDMMRYVIRPRLNAATISAEAKRRVENLKLLFPGYATKNINALPPIKTGLTPVMKLAIGGVLLASATGVFLSLR